MMKQISWRKQLHPNNHYPQMCYISNIYHINEKEVPPSHNVGRLGSSINIFPTGNLRANLGFRIQENFAQSKKLQIVQGGAIKVRGGRALTEMYTNKARKRNSHEHPSRNLWSPYKCKSSGKEGKQARFLLANHCKRCRDHSKNLRSLPKERQQPERSISSFTTHHTHMAVAKVEY